jgi:hypothetical protein
MSVRDLEKAYQEEAEKTESHEPKSDKTIYRYLKILEKAGLVTHAGQRMNIGKTVTETLFSRTAKIFLTLDEEPDWWNSKAGRDVAGRIGKILAYLLNSPEPPISEIQNLLIQYQHTKESEQERLMTSAPEEILKLITEGDINQLNKVNDFVQIFVTFMKRPSLFRNLRDLFKKST